MDSRSNDTSGNKGKWPSQHNPARPPLNDHGSHLENPLFDAEDYESYELDESVSDLRFSRPDYDKHNAELVEHTAVLRRNV